MMLQKRLEPLLSRKRVAIFEACIIGVVSGLAAVSLKQGVEWLTLWRTSSDFPLWISLPLIGLVGGWISGWLVERLAPEASGSGIPQVQGRHGVRAHSPEPAGGPGEVGQYSAGSRLWTFPG